jgi:hypothetical protein
MAARGSSSPPIRRCPHRPAGASVSTWARAAEASIGRVERRRVGVGARRGSRRATARRYYDFPTMPMSTRPFPGTHPVLVSGQPRDRRSVRPGRWTTCNRPGERPGRGCGGSARHDGRRAGRRELTLRHDSRPTTCDSAAATRARRSWSWSTIGTSACSPGADGLRELARDHRPRGRTGPTSRDTTCEGCPATSHVVREATRCIRTRLRSRRADRARLPGGRVVQWGGGVSKSPGRRTAAVRCRWGTVWRCPPARRRPRRPGR